MTIIAWDGTTLAADKAATNSGFSNTVTKIYRVPGGLVGLAGDGDRALDMLEWFRGGRVKTEFPKAQDSENNASIMFIDSEGRCYGYDKSPNPQLNEQRFAAMGCGRDYALAAMYLGFDARRAVEVACALDCFCGNGIDTLTL